MEPSPIRVVQELFETFDQQRTIESILEFLDPDVEWVDTLVTKTTLRGHDGFVEAMANLQAEGYQTQAHPEGFDQVDDTVVVAHGTTRLTTGSSYTDLPAYWAFDVRDEKIARGATATRRAEALTAIGLPG